MTTSVMAAPAGQEEQAEWAHTTINMIVGRLQYLQPDQLRDVFQFVQFLEYKAERNGDAAEEEALWAAAQAHDAYKAATPKSR
jgi:hypothetical protein